MARDDAYSIDILDAARLALIYVSGKTKTEFDKDIQCQDAVVRRLEIIGEAAVWDTVQNDLPPLIAALERIAPLEE
jgi:uncharacterized protein with HEPN domain